ncbi:glycosyltransferase family 2 protein [Salinivibrio kushneri]|uniref:glycosyltransferase family 2 protein n=1 Tax=Salinivibrio kushneri TaxID=1908198 RepID=UPI0022B2DD59|nr:glycosyltransferase [Salinivibrio kushneri]WBA17134.1 glycosyltransferase [Salinivibrio kushneri]
MPNQAAPPISLVTVSHGHETYIRELVDSLITFWPSPFELIIVDNLNSDAFDNWVADYSQQLDHVNISIRLYKFKQPMSFSVGNNFAVAKSRYEHLFIINPDCRLINASVHRWFVKHRERIDGHLYYPCLLNSDGSRQQNYNEWPSLPNQAMRLIRAKLGLSNNQRQKRRDWYFASAIITTKSTFLRLNGFDELFPLYCEDVELCHKAKLLDIPCVPITTVKMIHHLGGEAKHKHLRKAIQSNLIWRYARIRNIIQIKILKKQYDGKWIASCSEKNLY